MTLTTRTLLALALLAAVLMGLLVAGVAGVLARLDGATVPAAFTRAGVAFAGTVALLTAVLALLAGQ